MNPLIAFKTKSRGLKCDSEGCGFFDESIPLTFRSIRDNTNRPCPKCGANLLTEADAKIVLTIKGTALVVNAALIPLMLLLLPITLWRGCHKKPDVYKIKLNGTGTFTVEKKEAE